MKNEEEKMQEFIKDFTNAHDSIRKVKGIDEAAKVIKISLKTAIIIGIIVAIIVSIPVAIMIYDKMSVVFTMDKESYITKIEKGYRQRIEIIEDNSTKKGNGAIVFRTQKEPIVEFKSVKTILGGVENYYLEYEGNALNYYIENGPKEIFKGIEIEKTLRRITLNMFRSEEVEEFKAYLPIENYSQIEEGVHQLVELKRFMKEKIKKFEIPLYFSIGDYISIYDYKQEKQEEEIIEQEKQNYYWYLKNKGEDISVIPEEDLLKIDRPQTLDVYVNGERSIDVKETELNKENAYLNKQEEYEEAYAIATYNQDKKCYEASISHIIVSCDKFQILEDDTNAEFDFSYRDKKYSIHYFDGKVHGKKLPSSGDIEFLEEVLKIKLEYDYQNKKVNLIIP